MYHVVVRDPKGRALPSQITNYQHDHRGAAYDDLVFCVRLRGRRETRRVHARAVRHRHAARNSLRLRAHRAGASRRHGLGERSHRASHVRLRAQHARGRRRTPARQRHRRLGQARQLSHRRSLVCQGPRSVPQGRGRRRPRSLQHRRLARRRRHGRVGWQPNSGPPTISSARRCCRTGRGARRSSSRTRRGMRAPPARCRRPSNSRSTAAATSTRWKALSIFQRQRGGGRHRHHRTPAGSGISRGRADAGSRRPLDELLGREQGWRSRASR